MQNYEANEMKAPKTQNPITVSNITSPSDQNVCLNIIRMFKVERQGPDYVNNTSCFFIT